MPVTRVLSTEGRCFVFKIYMHVLHVRHGTSAGVYVCVCIYIYITIYIYIYIYLFIYVDTYLGVWVYVCA